jgi:D-3-phosphoglycerate dehydrogenase
MRLRGNDNKRRFSTFYEFIKEGILKVVIIRKVSKKTRQLIKRQFPEEWQIVIVPLEEVTNEIKDTDVLIPENSQIDPELLDKAKCLKLIQTGAGYDCVPIKECTKRGIYVANAAGMNTQAVAEHVFALILSWFKNIIALDTALKEGKDVIDYVGAELSEKIIGIVGLGNIGKQVVLLAASFQMKILGYHYRQIDIEDDIEMTDLPTLLKHSDIVTVHVALNDQTRHMMGRNEFELMKDDAFIINTSRGAVLDELALIEALQNGNIGGAGLDVFEKEPLPEDSPLRNLGNVILTPHMAGEPDSSHFHAKRFKFFAQNIKRIAEGKVPQNVLNQFKAGI